MKTQHELEVIGENIIKFLDDEGLNDLDRKSVINYVDLRLNDIFIEKITEYIKLKKGIKEVNNEK